MTLSTLSLLLADAPQNGGSPFGLVPVVLMFIIMYFVLIRPQRQRQKELEKLVASVKVGDHVVMSPGGEHGIITSVKEKTVMVKVADNVKIEYERSCIGAITKKSDVVEAATA